MSPFIKQAATLIKLVLCSGSVPGPLDNLAGRKAHPGPPGHSSLWTHFHDSKARGQRDWGQGPPGKGRKELSRNPCQGGPHGVSDGVKKYS